MYYRHDNATKQLDHPMKCQVQLRVQQHTIFRQSEQKPWQACEPVECYGLMQNLKFDLLLPGFQLAVGKIYNCFQSFIISRTLN
jgi:hypothetical protein